MEWRKNRHLWRSSGTFYPAIPDIKNIHSTITMRKKKKKRERKHKPKPGRLSVKKKADVAERLLRWRAGALSEWTPVCAASVSALHQRPRRILMSRAAARERAPSQRDAEPRCLRRLSEETSRWCPAEPVQIPESLVPLCNAGVTRPHLKGVTGAASECRLWEEHSLCTCKRVFELQRRHNDGNCHTSHSRRFHSEKWLKFGINMQGY